jgi:rod shape determining protein RodA
MKTTASLSTKLDWQLIIAYILLMLIGWISIYSAGYNSEGPNIFNVNYTYGKQFVWIVLSLIIGFFILNVNSKIFSMFANVYYFLTLGLLVLVFFLAKEVNGAKAWIDLGFFRLQPSEFAKFTTALALASYISNLDFNIQKKSNFIISVLIFMVPFFLVLAQHDMGSALVFLSFFLLLNRFGMPSWILYLGFYVIVLSVVSLLFPIYWIIGFLIVIASVILYLIRKRKEFVQFMMLAGIVILVSGIYSFSIDLVIKKLDKHQQDRIYVMLGKSEDANGKKLNNYQVIQSEIAVGAGQFLGKGFLKGTQSKGNFLPAKETDTIFCTLAEEWGFLGSLFTLGLLVFIIIRIIYLAEKQKSKFAKVYGYAVVCIFMIHYIINIGMTLGVLPVIGIPLPALSYGGSSLISFTILVFVFVKMDSEKWIYA